MKANRLILFALISMVILALVIWLIQSFKFQRPTEEFQPKGLSQFDLLWSQVFSSCGPGCHSAFGSVSNGPDLSEPSQFLAQLADKTIAEHYVDWVDFNQGYDLRIGSCNKARLIDRSRRQAERSLVAAVLVGGQTLQNFLNTYQQDHGTACTVAFNVHVSFMNLSPAQKNILLKWLAAGSPP